MRCAFTVAGSKKTAMQIVRMPVNLIYLFVEVAVMGNHSLPVQYQMTGFYAKSRRGVLFQILLITGLVSFSTTVAAHDFWIEPALFIADPGDVIPIVLRVGQDLSGDTVPYIDDWFSDYRVVTPAGPEPIDGMLGDDPAGRFIAGEPGIYLIGYRSTRDFVELEPEKFRSYLRKEGLERIIDARSERNESNLPARELYSRCAKSLLRIGAGGADDVFRLNLGYTLELMPERNPYALSPGDSLPIVLLYNGKPLVGALIVAFTSDRPEDRISVRTGANGRVELPLDHPGLWLIKSVHMIPTESGHGRAEWESFWASLTFRLPDRGGE
jgi:uncharacterized GH25 family protein